MPNSMVKSSNAKTVARLMEPDSSACKLLVHIRSHRFFSIANHRGRGRKGNPIDAVWPLANLGADGVAIERLIGGASQESPRAGQQREVVRHRHANLIAPTDFVRLVI